jgi:hypothetical protein
MSACRTLKLDTLQATRLTLLTLPPRFVFALVDVARSWKSLPREHSVPRGRPVKVVANVPTTVTLERLPRPGVRARHADLPRLDRRPAVCLWQAVTVADRHRPGGLLDDEELAGSAVVANCAMNRERQLTRGQQLHA